MVFEVTLERMIIFFLILAIGFTAAKAGVIKQESMPAFAQLITKILLPVMIFYSTYANCTRQDIFDNIVLIGLSAIFYAVISLLMFILAQLLRLPHDKDRIFQFCFIFGNTGFVGIPLLASVFPQGGLVYMMMFSIVDQLVFWTYGIWLSTGRLHGHKHRFNFRMLLTPNVIAIFVAIIFVLLQIPIPDLLKMTLGTVSNATSAMCMIYLGVLVCFSNVLPVLKRPEIGWQAPVMDAAAFRYDIRSCHHHGAAYHDRGSHASRSEQQRGRICSGNDRSDTRGQRGYHSPGGISCVGNRGNMTQDGDNVINEQRAAGISG